MSTPPNSEIADLFRRCQRLDWTYHMSDDNSVYVRGISADRSLRSDCEKAGMDKMYVDFYKHIWQQGPAPKLEDYTNGEG